jgi:hypothetical protein
MGKSFFLKMIGMQKVKAEFKNAWIEDAIQCGRILSFDFVKDEDAIKSKDDIPTFFASLMVYFLCLLFDGTRVDGINFEKISGLKSVTTFVGKQKKFNDWKMDSLRKYPDGMMDEYIRLTNIAFSVDPTSYMYKTPPVFLFDEVQSLSETTDVKSKLGKVPQFHTLLSLLLTALSTKHRPVCICTGTNNGEILSITEKSAIIPQVLSLTPLVEDYLNYWTQMTDEYNKNSNRQQRIQMAGDKDLIKSLAYASYQIPRLLFIAHQIWTRLRRNETMNRETYIQQFEERACSYYTELGSVLISYTPKEISHIILCCGVHWTVNDESLCVPGTKIKWSTLIRRSIIFPYLDNCYVFPFTLVWKICKDSHKNIKSNIENYCRETVKNLNVNDLFLSFDIVCSYDIYRLGMYFESLFASSLAVKYYICLLSDHNSSSDKNVEFTTIYDFKKEENISKTLLSNYKLNLSEGIFYPESEALASDKLPCAVVHNKKNHKAHHDILLPTDQGVIAVSAKASFVFNSEDLEKQLYISKKSNDQVTQLILLYLGNPPREEKEDVAFIDGSGVCNGITLQMFKLLKKLKSQNNRKK